MSSIDKKEKSQFLKEISCMTREDIREYLNRKNNTKIKIFCPVYFVNKDGSIEEPVQVPLILLFFNIGLFIFYDEVLQL